jgi:flotillin
MPSNSDEVKGLYTLVMSDSGSSSSGSGNKPFPTPPRKWTWPYKAAAAAGVGAGLFLLARYRISAPHQYLVRTGLGISNISISKKGIQWPFQTAAFIDVTPVQYPFSLNAMSAEKLQFVLPGVMTIGPKLDDKSLNAYAQLLSHGNANDLIHGIIEGETRILAANLKMDQLFQDRAAFKQQITKGVEEELAAFGLTVYNANMQDLGDTKDSEYFAFQRQKAREGANNEARVDVAEAQMKGNVGSKEREALQRQAQARLETTARETELKNEQQVERAKMELEQNKILFRRQNELTRVEANQAVMLKEVELQAKVEESRYQQELRKGRANTVVAAEVQASKAITEAEGLAESQRRMANADLYKAQRAAESAAMMWHAEAKGLEQVMTALGGSPTNFLWYRMLDKGILQQLAAENAKAVQNLQPKITVWNTGSGGPGGANPLDSIQKLFQFLPPVLTTIAEQTGMNVPFVSTPVDVPAKRNDGEKPSCV